MVLLDLFSEIFIFPDFFSSYITAIFKFPDFSLQGIFVAIFLDFPDLSLAVKADYHKKI